MKYRVGQKLGGSDTQALIVSLPPNFWPTLYIKIIINILILIHLIYSYSNDFYSLLFHRINIFFWRKDGPAFFSHLGAKLPKPNEN